MSPDRRPSRPGAATFRRRRVVVGMLALVVLAGLALGGNALVAVVRPGPAATPAASATPIGPSEEELANPVTCEPEAIELSIDLPGGGESIPQGRTVDFPIAVTNAGQVPCLLDLGSPNLHLTLSSGDDRVWASDDCQRGARGQQELLFDVDYTQTVTISWDGRRSVAGCAGGQDYAQEGTYRARVDLDLAGDETQETPAGGGTATAERVFGLD